MELETNLCLDIIVFGNCTKRKGCEICNKDANSKPIIFSNLDVNANEYIPKKKLASNKIKETAIQNAVSDEINNKSNIFGKINFNLEAQEYVPKHHQINNNFIMRQFEEDNDDFEGDELEIIMKDIMDDEELSDKSDEDRWWPKYQNCDCCKGFIYKCQGKACEHLDYCYCKIKDDVEEFN